MQNRTSVLSFIVVAAGTAALLATTANSQFGAPKSYVNLQATTPGSSQSGNANISGRMIAGRVSVGTTAAGPELDVNGTARFLGLWLPTGAATGRVLTSDATGHGSWLDVPALALPFAGSSGVPGAAAFSVTNTSQQPQSWGIFGKSYTGAGVYGFGASLGDGDSVDIPIGTLGQTPAPNGYGVSGLATHATGSNFGGYFNSMSTNGTGVYGSGGSYGMTGFASAGTGVLGSGNTGVIGMGTTEGVWGASSSSGVGVLGTATSGSIATPVTDGIGVFGGVGAASGEVYTGGWFEVVQGTGVRARAGGVSGGVGVFAEVESGNGKGIASFNYANTGMAHGGYFESWSAAGRAVEGNADNSSGHNYGVVGTSNGTGGRGVFGYASASSGDTFGGLFQSTSTAGIGVEGLALTSSGTNYGGLFESGGVTGYGVYGINHGTTGVSYGGYFECSSALGFGLYAKNTADGIGIYGKGGSAGGSFTTDSTSGKGVYGAATASSGTTMGVYGISSSNDGYGVYGYNSGGTAILGNGSSGVGVEGYASNGLGVYGVATWYEGVGVYGYNSSGSPGTGVYGKATDVGVGGLATDTTGVAYGGDFTSDSTDGYGVAGFAGASTGTAVGAYGFSNSTTGRGVYGWAAASTGVTYGVKGVTSSSSGWGGHFIGGNGLYASEIHSPIKAFIIDHPLDPENYYLQHSSVESPDMKNIYDGIVVTDGNGLAWVELPDYFEALNGDFRYQLTVIGQFAQAVIGSKIKNNRFSIRSDKPQVEVSWQVTGIRHDPAAEKYRIQVKKPKLNEHRGKYLVPEAYGVSSDQGIGYSSGPTKGPATKLALRRQPKN